MPSRLKKKLIIVTFGALTGTALALTGIPIVTSIILVLSVTIVMNMFYPNWPE